MPGTVAEFTYHFKYTFPQQDSWRLLLLPCAEKHYMLKMVHTKKLPRKFPLPPFRKNTPPGRNGRHPIIPCGSQGPNAIPPYFCVKGTYRNPSCRRTPQSETKHGEIPPLRGENIRGSGDHGPHTQHRGKPQLLNLYGSLRTMQDKILPPFKSNPYPL